MKKFLRRIFLFYFKWRLQMLYCKYPMIALYRYHRGGFVKDVQDTLVALRPGEWVDARGKPRDFK